MTMVPVVENPRRRGRRRRLTAKQLAYGFGGKRYRTRGRRRHNPALASLAANPRRRRSRRGGYSVRHIVRRHHNPRGGFLGGLGGFDFGSALWVGAGAIGSTVVPGLVRRFWPALPGSGPMGYLVRVGGTLATAWAIRTFAKNPQGAKLAAAGGLGLIFVDLFRDYLAPMVGLAGLGNDSSLVMADELTDAMSGYTDEDTLSGFVESDVLSGLGQGRGDIYPSFVG